MLLLIITRYFRTKTQHFCPGHAPDTNLKPITLSEDRLQEAINIIRLESDLQNALNENQFRIVFQPIVSLSTQEVMGFEALLRWNSPKHGLVSPLVFIPIIEYEEQADLLQSLACTLGQGYFLPISSS